MAFGGQSQQRWGDNSINTTDYIRDFQLTDLAGRVCHSFPTRGRGWILFAFFGLDGQSAQTLQALQKLADGYKESGKLTVWGISQETDPAVVKSFAAELGITFPLMLDHQLYHSGLYGIPYAPAVFLVSSDGKVQRKALGYKPTVLSDMSQRYATFAELPEPVEL
ncbi:peroxiredoxin family protein [Armatimonas rosea]|uniref:Peroxiredoxin n=1 Tax=Armatimonas rosea TaxID=685828 RepID=A0A7W9W8V5_ARMRO|nr:TlpA disulfide reductase family protein [Armatimonas rosea]MBB6052530.1 peroxiredoxin [Armatimonas rosea]